MTAFMKNKELRPAFTKSVYEAAVEILGSREAGVIFGDSHTASSGRYSDISAMPDDLLAEMSNEFIIKYHVNTARGLMIRIGEASFNILRRKFDEINDMGNIENRLCSFEKKLQDTLQRLVTFISLVSDIPLELEKINQGRYCLNLSKKGIDKSTGDLPSYYFAGLLRAFSTWLDSRQNYSIEVLQQDDAQLIFQTCLTVKPAQ